MLGAVGNTVEATAPLSTVRLIEGGIQYELQEDHGFQAFELDGMGVYDLQSEGRLSLKSSVTPVIENLFVSGDIVVCGAQLATPPAAVTDTEPSSTLTTALSNRYRPMTEIHLTQPHRPPKAKIHLSENQPILVADGNEFKLTAGTEERFELPPETVTAETITVLDERVETENVPVQERGLKTEYGSVSVDAIPTIKVRDHGEVTVEKET